MTRSRRDPDLVRAYVRTGGRSRATRDLDLVTLVAAALPPAPGLGPDARRVLGLCGGRGVLSIAEIAAYLDLPPSVVKIVVSDLMDGGHLSTPTPAETVPEIALLEEVLNGLRALSA
ncbi:DUF742 domain-containing protein [Nocardia puris]|uniref:Uncharacterized protein DUF742 n=1 Tax=Nocardia puris TaxID=208602 RepID=A0A366DU70_9NOCA|nr:DUF742 domain-containing protein [Nocardia puris]MBF6210220.1 DUF742 domain-containing protein [Nocardia puris]MBF6367297.1 DUF742 domain-containing protein [Nocardia puris]MBF6457481.1 DUF742 domain-containing protein [Nocardia puris]RBO93636.1 uncharacterized protein DUF742 [Nocardia puris]